MKEEEEYCHMNSGPENPDEDENDEK